MTYALGLHPAGDGGHVADMDGHATSPKKTPWPLIAILYAVGLLAGAQFAKVSLTLSGLAETYPGAPVAFAVSAVAVMGICFGVMAGGLTASLGPRRAILGALLLSGAVGMAQAVLPPFPIFMAFRVLEGAGHLILVVAVPTLMAALAHDKDRALVMGIWATFFGVGFTITALWVGSSVALVYAVHGALVLTLAVLLAVMLPKGVVAQRRALPRLRDHFAIYSTPRLFAPGLGHGLYAMLFLALVTFLPEALDTPWLAPVLPIAGIVGSLSTGILARFIAPGHLVWTGFLVMAALFLVAIFAGGAAPWVLIVALGLSGVVAGAGFAAVPWLNNADADRALANGALAQIGNVGTFSGTPLFAVLAPAMLLPTAIVICVIAAALTGFAYRAARTA